MLRLKLIHVSKRGYTVYMAYHAHVTEAYLTLTEISLTNIYSMTWVINTSTYTWIELLIDGIYQRWLSER